ncbi:phosphate ABC transporter permease subunit PstC [Spirochaeta africana]|uniref:Phosphate transport system permease protein n=1 Tax=Spirochaeta africana (strain ATCC 700263 / DSM 8902 / Z-7692) TaxID=889378 RepID=H9UGU0_SPIAZ|nr:phosphate ABC transporter permease subunit PstC [Spirochaeta africana]AFG36733.1 phosphate ABC transporter, permease protein PstC [Spirochaeta africana DSM 8902]
MADITPARYRQPGDRVFKAIIVTLSSGIILLAAGMAITLWLEAAPSFREFGYLSFLTETTWDPVARVHGALPFILGTLITSFAALALSLLPALGVAIFSAEYAPKWLSRIINALVDLLAAIPSVVIGLWAIFNFAPFMRDTFYLPIYMWAAENAEWMLPYLGAPSNYNLITASIILALMIIPYTVALSRDAIKLVPRDQREAAYALGATRWEVIRMSVLPYARSGIIAGVLLSLARGLGETMAVAMLIGNSNRVPFTLFGPAATMPSLIINEFREAVETLHYTSIMAVGFYLFLLTIAINLAASLIQRKLTTERRAM